MIALAAVLGFALAATPAIASPSDGKEFLRGDLTQGGTLTLTHNGKTYKGQFVMRVTRRAKAAKRNVSMQPHQWGSSDLVSRARTYLNQSAAQIGLHRHTLWCAAFMNHVLRQSGRNGTGSDLARSFASWGRRVSGPTVGAIAVMSRGRRGGHVGVVSGTDSRGNPIIISGNHNGRVRETPYPAGRIYAYVMP